MKEGLLWFDDNPSRDLADKISQAAQRYEEKHGTSPSVCFVHPSALSDNGNGKVKTVGQVSVKPLPTVLVHHFWTGIEKTETNIDK